MIAFFLVAVCAVPVVSGFVKLYTEQKLLNGIIALDHTARLAHAKIVEDLYFRGSKGETLQELLRRDLSVSDLDPTLLASSPYDLVYELKFNRPRTVKKQETAKNVLLNLTIKASKKDDSKKTIIREYLYSTYVSRDVKEGTNQVPQGKVPQVDQGGTGQPMQPKARNKIRNRPDKTM